jgi:hypothetical protein
VIESEEQGEVLLAASVAVAWKVVEVSSETVTPMPDAENVAAGPVPATGEVQVESVYRVAMDPDAADPSIRGELLLAGDAGVVPVKLGAAGAVESSTYVVEADEQEETLPAPSVALAKYVVEESSATVTGNPGEAKVSVEPVAANADVQSLFV